MDESKLLFPFANIHVRISAERSDLVVSPIYMFCKHPAHNPESVTWFYKFALPNHQELENEWAVTMQKVKASWNRIGMQVSQ